MTGPAGISAPAKGRGAVISTTPSSRSRHAGPGVLNPKGEFVGYGSTEINFVIGKGSEVGETMLNDRRIPLISATGSTKMGKHVGGVVGERLGSTILELGGNNAIIVTENADLDMSIMATLDA